MSHETYLGQKGYSIYKKSLSIKEQISIREELAVKPYIPKAPTQPLPYPIYRESTKKFYLPRFYGINTFGIPNEMKISEGDKINLKFNGTLRENQNIIVSKYLNYINNENNEHGNGGLLELHTGFGKCLAKNTTILMYNGEIKKVQDIEINDQIMGDDSSPRKILSLCTGKEKMYRIIPKKGNSYDVNESHILSLKIAKNLSKDFVKGKIIDISIFNLLKLQKIYKENICSLFFGYKVGVQFNSKQILFDPYLLGYYLGSLKNQFLNKNLLIYIKSKIIYSYIDSLFKQEFFKKYILFLEARNNNYYYIKSKLENNYFEKFLAHNNLLESNRYIPQEFKCNIRIVQLKVIAGLIDAKGYKKNNFIIINLKHKKLTEDIIYIARSLGFFANYEKKLNKYFKIKIKGNNLYEIPCLIPKNKCKKSSIIYNYLSTKIKIKYIGIGEYYGFTIDGNRRFLLGDFTVTHNTVLALKIISLIKLKTLIIVHKGFLVDQWIERIQEFLPEARIGKIQGQIIDIEDKDIVIGMLQSLSMKEYPEDQFKSFGLTTIDECFPYNTPIYTNKGLIFIGDLYNKWEKNEELPLILSFNQKNKEFEFKNMKYSWRKHKYNLLKLKMINFEIKCTPEHKILTLNGYKKANKLRIGDLIISKYDNLYSNKYNFREISMALNEDQLQIIYGSYLGNGLIQQFSINNNLIKRYRLIISYYGSYFENNNLYYFKWLANMFGINQIEKLNNTDNSCNESYYFISNIFDLNTTLPNDINEVPKWLINKIDERGILIWYLDKGFIYNNLLIINTNNFSLNIQELFKKKFKFLNIECEINNFYNYFYLVFDYDNSLKFFKLITPFMGFLNTKINKKYSWNNKFLSYGTIPISKIENSINSGYLDRIPYVYDIEVEDNHNYIIANNYKFKNDFNNEGIVVSNCHHLSAEIFCRALQKVVTKYTLGLSATMNRKDGLSKVFKMFLGEIIHTEKRKDDNSILVKAVEFKSNDEDFNEIEYDYRGNPKYSTMIGKLCNFNKRSELIVSIIKKELEDINNEQIMILAHNKNLLIYLFKAIEYRNIASVGFYIGGMKQKDLKESEKKKIIIATYSMASEGLDIKTLTTLILATPKTEVEQAVGRIMRVKHNQPLIIDIIDQHIIFKNQWIKRKAFYQKNNYKIITTDDYLTNCWEEISKVKSNKLLKIIDEKEEISKGKCLIKIS